jgi:hypothetical protein
LPVTFRLGAGHWQVAGQVRSESCQASGKKPGMGDGVSPRGGPMSVCEQESKKDDELHGATEQGYTSDAAGGRPAMGLAQRC